MNNFIKMESLQVGDRFEFRTTGSVWKVIEKNYKEDFITCIRVDNYKGRRRFFKEHWFHRTVKKR